jgi:hypothetical protein
MTIIVIVFIIMSGFFIQSINLFYETQHLLSKAGVIADFIHKVSDGYVQKIVAEESEDGYRFEGLPLASGSTWNIAADQLIPNLQSDGSSGDPNDPACIDPATGTTYGLSKYGFIQCDFQDHFPYSEGKFYEATFTRTAPATPAPNYATGYSQIRGTITFGSAPGDPFSLDGINPDPQLAKLIYDKLNQKPIFRATNLLLAATTTYELTRDGTLQVKIDLTRNSEIAIRSDGATPWNRDQSLGNNSLTEVRSLVWSSVSSELLDTGNIGLAGQTGANASSIFFDKNNTGSNYIQLDSAGLNIVANTIDISNDVNIGNDLEVAGNAIFGGDITVDGDVTIKDSGVSLRKVPQTIGVVANNGYVPYPDCRTPINKRLIPFQSVDIPTATATAPLLGFYPVVIPDDANSRWQVSLKNITEDGTEIDASANSRIGIITLCDE